MGDSRIKRVRWTGPHSDDHVRQAKKQSELYPTKKTRIFNDGTIYRTKNCGGIDRVEVERPPEGQEKAQREKYQTASYYRTYTEVWTRSRGKVGIVIWDPDYLGYRFVANLDWEEVEAAEEAGEWQEDHNGGKRNLHIPIKHGSFTYGGNDQPNVCTIRHVMPSRYSLAENPSDGYAQRLVDDDCGGWMYGGKCVQVDYDRLYFTDREENPNTGVIEDAPGYTDADLVWLPRPYWAPVDIRAGAVEDDEAIEWQWCIDQTADYWIESQPAQIGFHSTWLKRWREELLTNAIPPDDELGNIRGSTAGMFTFCTRRLYGQDTNRDYWLTQVVVPTTSNQVVHSIHNGYFWNSWWREYKNLEWVRDETEGDDGTGWFNFFWLTGWTQRIHEDPRAWEGQYLEGHYHFNSEGRNRVAEWNEPWPVMGAGTTPEVNIYATSVSAGLETQSASDNIWSTHHDATLQMFMDGERLSDELIGDNILEVFHKNDDYNELTIINEAHGKTDSGLENWPYCQWGMNSYVLNGNGRVTAFSMEGPCEVYMKYSDLDHAEYHDKTDDWEKYYMMIGYGFHHLDNEDDPFRIYLGGYHRKRVPTIGDARQMTGLDLYVGEDEWDRRENLALAGQIPDCLGDLYYKGEKVWIYMEAPSDEADEDSHWGGRLCQVQKRWAIGTPEPREGSWYAASNTLTAHSEDGPGLTYTGDSDA